jgi:serine protease AprX
VIAAIEQAIALKTNTTSASSTYPWAGRYLRVIRRIRLSGRRSRLESRHRGGVAAGNDGRDKSFGNEGYGTVMAPGNDPYVITVGAMRSMGTPSRTDDLVARYSSKGPSQIDHVVKPDIMAPGNEIVSLLAIAQGSRPSIRQAKLRIRTTNRPFYFWSLPATRAVT